MKELNENLKDNEEEDLFLENVSDKSPAQIKNIAKCKN